MDADKRIIKPTGNQYTDAEHAKAIPAMEKIIQGMAKDKAALATMLYYCTDLQRHRTKKIFARYLGSSEMDRLYFYGMYLVQGKDSTTGMAEHLALKANGIKKTTWERLDLSTKRKLNDPDHVITIARCEAKPLRKPVKELTGLELNQILGEKKILTPEQQLPKLRFTAQTKQEQQYAGETPEDGSVCERTQKILLADTKEDLILVSENHRQHASFSIIKKFLRESGYVVYKVGENGGEKAAAGG